MKHKRKQTNERIKINAHKNERYAAARDYCGIKKATETTRWLICETNRDLANNSIRVTNHDGKNTC